MNVLEGVANLLRSVREFSLIVLTWTMIAFVGTAAVGIVGVSWIERQYQYDRGVQIGACRAHAFYEVLHEAVLKKGTPNTDGLWAATYNVNVLGEAQVAQPESPASLTADVLDATYKRAVFGYRDKHREPSAELLVRVNDKIRAKCSFFGLMPLRDVFLTNNTQ
jgi:hypothetical protein